MRILLIVAALILSACGGEPKPLPVVDQVELQRYTGTWYEIARLPHWFQRGCRDSSATYRLNDDGTLKVVNRCRREDSTSQAEGVARVVDENSNAKLKVRFDNWFSNLFPTIAEGNYWIIHLSEDYDVAMVGEPERKYFWILARQPSLPDERYQALVDKARRLGFPVEELKRNRDLIPDNNEKNDDG